MNQTHPIRNTFNTEAIKTNINSIKEYIKASLEKNKSHFELELDIIEKFPEFYHEYPFLVKKVCKDDNLDTLYKMLDNLDMVEKGDKSFAEVEKTLGHELAHEFIHSKIDL